MLSTERFAIAARLHVVLRRKTGRVTDTEWMATNTEYAAEIVRFTLSYAKDASDTDTAELANRLAEVMLPARAPSIRKPDLAVEGNGLIRYMRGLR